jgi:signal transduction histidine kinase
MEGARHSMQHSKLSPQLRTWQRKRHQIGLSVLLWTARLLWGGGVLFLIAEALVHLSWPLARDQQICSGAFCWLTPLQVQELQAMNIPVAWYIIYQLLLSGLISGVWLALGISLFWQTWKRSDTQVLFAWLVSLVFIAYAVSTALPASPRSPIAATSWIRASGETLLFLFLYWYWRVAHQQQRQQTRAIAWIVVVANVVTLSTRILYARPPHPVLLAIVLNTIFALAMLLVPLALGRAIIRYHFWEIHTFLNRTLLYGAFTACMLGTYIVIVGGLGTLLQRPNNPVISLLATGTIAALFQPLRASLQTMVNRLLYGERDNPSAVLARLGLHLETTLAPEAALSVIVSTIAQTLKLPAAALLLKQGETFVEAARYGDEQAQYSLTLPLVSQGDRLGTLCLASRTPGEAFSSAETKRLTEVVRQASIAIQAGQATRDLQRARERLVRAREEERRRLQRELHDGLGPTLASFSQRIDAACHLVLTDPQEAITQLQALKKQSRAGIAEMRRMVYALRPPILEELGLLAAIQEQIIPGTRSTRLQILFEHPEELPPLPAAVEVAAYRIIQEALTNVVRHAQADHCHLRLNVLSGLLLVEISDDGIGISRTVTPGVGISSMRERSAELGGTCSIAARETAGTQVIIRIPCSKEESCNGLNSSRDC